MSKKFWIAVLILILMGTGMSLLNQPTLVLISVVLIIPFSLAGLIDHREKPKKARYQKGYKKQEHKPEVTEPYKYCTTCAHNKTPLCTKTPNIQPCPRYIKAGERYQKGRITENVIGRMTENTVGKLHNEESTHQTKPYCPNCGSHNVTITYGDRFECKYCGRIFT